jgi:hypothetical protein
MFSKSFSLSRYFHLTDQLIEELPPYMFLTAFSQLVSRICHPHPDVFRHLKTIIVYMLLVYSQQSLWMLMPVYKVCVLATAEARKSPGCRFLQLTNCHNFVGECEGHHSPLTRAAVCIFIIPATKNPLLHSCRLRMLSTAFGIRSNVFLNRALHVALREVGVVEQVVWTW